LVHLKDAGTHGKVTLKSMLAELFMEKEFVAMNLLVPQQQEISETTE
jgi:UDP-N-acetylmuramate-alanine ligase